MPERVASRFLAARGPQVTINGKKYVLSDVWGAVGDLVDALGGGQPGGPTVHEGPKRYSFLWAYDTERRMVAMWRWSDGSSKLYGKAGPYMRDIHQLMKKGQLNRVTTAEMKTLERAMVRKEQDFVQQMKEDLAAQASTFEKMIGKLVRDFFKKKVEPKVLAQWVIIDQGVLPDGFRPQERLLDIKPAEMQAKMHAAGEIFEREFSLDKIEEYITEEFDGLNPLDNPEVDSQLAYWERNDVIDEFYDRHHSEISARPPDFAPPAQFSGPAWEPASEPLRAAPPAPKPKPVPERPERMTPEMEDTARSLILKGTPRVKAIRQLMQQGKSQGLGLKGSKSIYDYVRHELETQGRA